MKPAVLTRLAKNKLIDVQVGFVDTFNYILDFVQNLKGDGDGAAGSISLDRKRDDHPIIRLTADGIGGSNIKLVGTDASEAIVGDPNSSDFKVVTFASAADANISVSILGDGQGNATVTIGAYYVTGSSAS